MTNEPTPSKTRIGAVAGLAGAAAVFALVLGAGPSPSVFQLAGANEDISGSCDEAEHANDPECQGTTATDDDGAGSPSTIDDDGTTSTTVDDTTSTTAGGVGTGAPAGEVRSLDAAGAGTVIYVVEGGGLRLVSATPAAGWRVEVEQSGGREVELDFRSGSKRVQVNLEIEDGQVRERVRFRDDADDTDIRTEDGVAQDDDNSGPGSGEEDDDEDRSGSNSGPG